MKRYKVTLETDDGREFEVTVPANSRKQARQKADRLYDDEEVKSVELDEGSDNDKPKKGEKNKGKKGSGSNESDDESDDEEDSDDESDDEEDSDSEEDSEPEEEHWYFRGRK